MKFVEKIDELISEITVELEKVRKARHDKNHHAGYVAEKINKIIREESKVSPDNPVLPLGKALSEVSNIISESFDHLDKMNPYIVDTIMNNINKLDTFKWIDKILNKDSGDCFKFFKALYKDRNDLTHNLTDTFETTKTLSTNIRIMRNMIFALFICTHCNIDMLHKKLPESIIEREYGSTLKKLQMNQNKFKDITLKFKKEYKPFKKKY